MTTIKERVQAGAALLDKKLPGWWDGKEEPTIDLGSLSMGHHKKCVLGQCFGEYEDGCARLGIPAWTVDFKEGKPNAIDHGFLDIATAPWRREIKRRRREEKI